MLLITSGKPRNTLTEVTSNNMKRIPLSSRVVGAKKSNIVQFPNERKELEVFVPTLNKNHRIFTIEGDSLETPDDAKGSVYSKEKVIVEVVEDINEIKCNSVCVVEILAEGTVLAKKVCVHGDVIVLKSVNPKYEEERYGIDEVRIIGVIVATCRSYPR